MKQVLNNSNTLQKITIIIFVTFSLFLLNSATSLAQLQELPSVAAGFNKKTTKQLNSRRSVLEKSRIKLNREINRFQEECGLVMEDETSLVAKCSKREVRLQSDVDKFMILYDKFCEDNIPPVYTINIVRGSESGILTYKNADVSVHTICWWDPLVRVKRGVYKKCSRTIMMKKKCKAIFINGATGSKGKNDIFIHSGSGPEDSDGCIVIDKDELHRIWNNIEPPDGFNVTVTIEDKVEVSDKAQAGRLSLLEAIKDKEKGPVVKAMVYRTLALTAASQGDHDEAVNLLKKALAEVPDNKGLQDALRYELHTRDKNKGELISNPKVDVLLDALGPGKTWDDSISFLEDKLSREQDPEKKQAIRDAITDAKRAAATDTRRQYDEHIQKVDEFLKKEDQDAKLSDEEFLDILEMSKDSHK